MKTVSAQPGRWAPPVNISNTPYGSFDPDMAIGPDGHIHVVWPDYSRLGSFDWRDILYAVYDGYEWSEPVQVSAYDTTYSYTCHIAVDSTGRPHVVWNHRAVFIDADIYYAALTDSGWIEPLNLTTHYSTSATPDIAIDGNGNIHVVWADYYYGNYDIFHRYFNGNMWTDFVNVSNDPIDSAWPQIGADSENNLHMTWEQLSGGGIDCEILYSLFNEISWSPSQNISQNPALQSTDPDIALDSFDNPHIVWRQTIGGFYCEIYYNYFNGEEWMEPEDITNLGLRSDYPSLAINSQDVKCMLFSISSQQGDQYVNYTFGLNSHWTYPDTVFDDYICCHSTIAIDDNDVLHACIILAFNIYGDIGYTYFRQTNSVEEIPNELPSNYLSIYSYPNPFNKSTRIFFSVPRISKVNLNVYNIYGQLIKKLANSSLPAGEHICYWNGTDQLGREVSGGVYFIQFLVNEESTVRKAVLIK